MPGQGWAGSKPVTDKWLCAVCARDGRNVGAVTQVQGTMVCLEHIRDA